MHSEVYQNGSLLHKPIRGRVVFDLTLLVFSELVGPDFDVLQVYVIGQNIVQVMSVPLIVVKGKLMLLISMMDLVLTEGDLLIVACFFIEFFLIV